ncbi:putative membrane protein YfcA [Aeromicrobium panaciterrae]|uniref:Probable membrane transporter protein n=1 Tax=Aeromicrobium panaciterrae TaxID=363861 RepID=A0ABU1UKC5_9ACTN|nr:sulfite exporter TauE/SafE family protein [Aeromicrobium panaciterrae]MDR7085619.1 putative membrane protein YfcA [Aeromicrobium panaciterrae]
MLEGLVIFAAGIWAGMINTIVGSGTLITFPTLLLFGYPALTANVSNNIGLVAGGISGTYGYRREARELKTTLVRLAPASVLGATTGAALLLTLPDSSFDAIVPALIALALFMVIVGPSIQRRVARRKLERETDVERVSPALFISIFGLGVYGGYFGAAQGILLMGLMGIMLSAGIQALNGLKNVLGTLVNAVAAVAFMIFAWDRIDWKIVALIGGGSLIGGLLGSRIGRRLPPLVLRAIILLIGTLALIKIIWFD